MCEIREKRGFVVTPSVLAGARVDGGSITEIGNTKRGKGGGVGSWVVWDCCFCRVFVLFKQWHPREWETWICCSGDRPWTTDLKLGVFSKGLQQEETVGNNPHRSGQQRDYVEASILAVCFGVSWTYVFILSIMASQFCISYCNILQIPNHWYIWSFSEDWCFMNFFTLILGSTKGCGCNSK